MKILGLKEAYFDLKQLYEEFRQQPVRPFGEFKDSLENLVVAGNKMLMYNSYSHSLLFTQNLKLHLEHINRILTRLRLADERQWTDSDLEGLKFHMTHYLDEVMDHNLRTYFSEAKKPSGRMAYPFFRKLV